MRGSENGFPWSTDKKPASASWNIFLDAVSAAQVWAFGLATVLIPDNAFQLLQVDPRDPETYTPKNCANDLLRDIVLNWAPSQNEEWSGLRYWDQATAVASWQMILGKEEHPMCQQWAEINISVSLQNDPTYATYLQGGIGTPSQAWGPGSGVLSRQDPFFD